MPSPRRRTKARSSISRRRSADPAHISAEIGPAWVPAASHSARRWSSGPAPDPTSRSSACASDPVSQAFASVSAESQSPRRGCRVASALEREQPVPCVLVVAIRGPSTTWTAASAPAAPGVTSASGQSSTRRCPPLTTTRTPCRTASVRPCASASSHPSASRSPRSAASSGRFGVTTSASGSRRRSASVASASSRASPDWATITGSSTTTGGRTARSQSATSSTTAADPSMPIFTASIATSSDTASSCARRNATGGTWISRTPVVFCATSAVTTAMP